MLANYFPILVFTAMATGLSIVLLSLPYLIAKFSNKYPDKYKQYECGFEAFDDARKPFDVRFYLVSILFVIFDLEVAFLFPWAVSFGTFGIMGYSVMMIFLLVLTIGFIYEWKKGALEWD
ncbi:MAG: NAD(P)H-quinone oxidoreductase subunit 3 [Proteobacteria bacterium]|jgi:NADH-quinone oxidoreductase subunit A|nr:MAG: NAD(P)H-quinone oxidoreductase subunit 3 [Pseudomonadota bacterium]|tara:strand:- start:169 stop:528 length:360 start_codon:yes stop_codon:yes gene_type:complete